MFRHQRLCVLVTYIVFTSVCFTPCESMSVRRQSLIDPPKEKPASFDECEILESVRINGDTNADEQQSEPRIKIWENATIPFVISRSVDSEQEHLLEKAIAEYHERTCIRFVETNRQSRKLSDYLYIEQAKGGSSSSHVGREGGKQSVYLAKDADYGTYLHELFHAVGFSHEQCRPDRDNYIKIHWDNIKEGHEHNFEKKPSYPVTDVPYDYHSIVHYSAYAFSRNDRKTMVARKDLSEDIGRGEHLTEYDIMKISKLYNCNAAEKTGSYPDNVQMVSVGTQTD